MGKQEVAHRWWMKDDGGFGGRRKVHCGQEAMVTADKK